MLRWSLSIVAALVVVVGVLVVPAVFNATGIGSTRFPDPIDNQAVYDPAGAIDPQVEQVLEAQIDAVELRSGAEIVIYVRFDPGITFDRNGADSRALIDQWGIGRQGFDDGFVVLLTFDESSYQHGELHTFAGGGFRAVYLPDDAQAVLRDEIIIPAIRQGALDGGLLAAMGAVDAAISPEATGRLEFFRVLNAMVGIPGGILALLVTLGLVYGAWRRYGDDPDLVDSESVLMAGPPAEMTPPLATVLRNGRASAHSINTVLVELASRSLIKFHNLDRVREVKSDDDPDPLTDPAIEVLPPSSNGRRLAVPQAEALDTIRRQSAGGLLARERLWGMNEALSGVKGTLEDEAVRLGWLSRLPTPMITRWVVIGVIELLAGIGLVWLGYSLPMSGLTLFGAALAVGGVGTVALGSAMSQRTPKGAYVDAMLKAYRRTLKKTLEQAQNMNEVVAQPQVRTLADTPDKAVLWGIALGLHKEVAGVLERGLADPRVQSDPSLAYYPAWLGSSSSSSTLAGGSAAASGPMGLFSGSGTPDIGGMFGALGSIGSTPSSSSSSGGGFGGGGSSGGGGGGSSF